MNLFTYSKNLSVNPLRMLYRGDVYHKIAYRDPTLILKNHTRSRIGHVNLHGFFVHSKRGGHWRKSTNDREGSWYKNYDAASGPIN
jgi:hypothetical protein